LSTVQAIDRQAQRAPDGTSLHGERARSERGTLYRRVQQYAAGFFARVDAGTGSALARRIEDGFDAFIKCGVLSKAS
jgi:hypothetical protein